MHVLHCRSVALLFAKRNTCWDRMNVWKEKRKLLFILIISKCTTSFTQWLNPLNNVPRAKFWCVWQCRSNRTLDRDAWTNGNEQINIKSPRTGSWRDRCFRAQLAFPFIRSSVNYSSLSGSRKTKTERQKHEARCNRCSETSRRAYSEDHFESWSLPKAAKDLDCRNRR